MQIVDLVKFDEAQLLAADANGDGSIDVTDATHIQRFLVNLIPALGK